MIERIRQFLDKAKTNTDIVREIEAELGLARKAGGDYMNHPGLVNKLSELRSSGVSEEELVERVAEAMYLKELGAGGEAIGIGLWGPRLFVVEAQALVRQRPEAEKLVHQAVGSKP